MNALSDLLSSRQDDFLNGAVSGINPPLPITCLRRQAHYPLQIQSSPPSQLKSMIYAMKDQLNSMLRVLNGESSDLQTPALNASARHSWPSPSDEGELEGVEQQVFQPPPTPSLSKEGSQRGEQRLGLAEQLIEGVFNGQKMVGPDGQEYAVPPNYASKSKLVEGDLLKLTITRHGQFIYKQVGPVERERRRGELVSDQSTGQWSVLSDEKIYKVLTASVTFYKGQAGDEAVFLVPKDANGSAVWGAVENIIHTA